MKAQDFVRATAAYHDELNPAAWVGTEMKPEVRARLIEIAQLFVEYLDVPGFEVYDVVLTGSLANYNWTKFSDFDLHIVTDYRDLQCDDLAEAFYRAKKTIWNDRHDITIYGHEVELYVEDVNEPPVSGGVFSVYNGEWIKTPVHQNPNVNDTAIVRKVIELQDQIERAISTADDPEDLKRLTDKLRKLRQAGLDAGGEFSVENLAFKTLRNMGIIKALHDAYTEKQDDSMRISEVTEGYIFKGKFPFDVDHMPGAVIRNADMATDNVKTKDKAHWDRAVNSINAKVFDDMSDFRTDSKGEQVTGNSAVWAKWDNATQTGWFNAKGRPLKPWPIKDSLNEFDPGEGHGRPKFIPWHDFIEGVKGIVGKEFEVVEKVVKSTIQDRFVPHDAMEFGPTMLYSYYEARAGRGKGAVSTRGAIQVGKYIPNSSQLGTRNFITTFNILKGHPFERHFDLTPENISKIASIILGNTEGAYQFKPQGVAEHIVKVGNEYELKSKKTGKNLGKYPTRAGAEKRERQVQYFKHKK